MNKEVQRDTFENHWDLLLCDCAKGREKETKTQHSHIFYKNAYRPTNKTSNTS